MQQPGHLVTSGVQSIANVEQHSAEATGTQQASHTQWCTVERVYALVVDMLELTQD